MQWETPSFVEVDMNAEIGGYQGEDEDSGYTPPFIDAPVTLPCDA